MRWYRPDGGSVGPDVFIPIAEESGLIGAMGAWLLDKACQEAMRWPRHMRISVNVSPVQLRLPGFLDTLREALARSALDPRRLELEVTEGILMNATAEMLALMKDIRALGVRLAMDDFGTGYASLAYLQKFHFDKIKIDRSFIKDLGEDPNAAAILRAVVALGDALGMETNAEGVENQNQLDLLRQHGCQEAQGYLFWAPMPADEMASLVKSQSQTTDFMPITIP